MALDAQRMRRGEDLLARDVGVADDAVLGARGAALPFVPVGEADGEIGAGPVKCSDRKRLPFSQSRRVCRAALCAVQAATGSGWSTREAAKIASASFATATSCASPGNTRPAQEAVG